MHFHAFSRVLSVVGTPLVLPTTALSDWVISRHKILEAQHGELWTAFHHFNRPLWFKDVHDAIRLAFPTSTFYSIQYTYFGNLIRRKKTVRDTQWARDMWNIKYFVGSEYCEGLREHTPIAIEHGIYGFITSPLYLNRRLEQWMLDDLSWAMKQLQDRNG